MRNLQGRTTIARRIKRMEKGNFVNHHFCRNGIWELVIDTGPGFRVYYSIIDNSIVILLCAGDKSSQQKDINNAIEYLKDFAERN